MLFSQWSRITAALFATSSLTLAFAGTLMIDPTPLVEGNVGSEYTAFITSSGGDGPHTFKVIDGRLPDRLRMERSFGVQSTLIHGTPREVGSSSFTVEVKDTAGNTATAQFTIVINPPLPLEITNPSSALPDGSLGQEYAANIFTTGGVSPYRWEITAGDLPEGLRLRDNQISGTPTAAGTFTFTVTVRDRQGTEASREFSITIL